MQPNGRRFGGYSGAISPPSGPPSVLSRSTAILAQYPDIALKPVRPYLVANLARNRRSIAVVGHYTAAARLLTDTALVESHTSGHRLLAMPTAAGHVTVELTGQTGCAGRGEWRLLLSLEDIPVIEMALAIVDRPLLRLWRRWAEISFYWRPEVLVGRCARSRNQIPDTDQSHGRFATENPAAADRPDVGILIQTPWPCRGIKTPVTSFRGTYTSCAAASQRITTASGRSPGVGQYVGRCMPLPLAKAQRDPADYKPNKRAQIRKRQRLQRSKSRVMSANLFRPLLRS